MPPEAINTHLVKVNAQGLLTLSLPDMVGRYLLIEQRDGQLVLSPFGVDTETATGAIAHCGTAWTMLGATDGRVPTA